jgi:hypothetical protein
VRVVKSKKDSAWDSMKEGIARIKNARRNTDWPLIQDEFAAVNKMIEKSKMLIITNGFPLFYIKMVAELEDHVQLAVKNKAAVAALKPAVSRALKQMKLQIKKHNDQYREQIADFRENPEKYGEDEAEEESEDSSSDSDEDSDEDAAEADSESSEDETPAPKAKGGKAAAKKDDVSTLLIPFPFFLILVRLPPSGIDDPI